jgi:hypothetical protein
VANIVNCWGTIKSGKSQTFSVWLGVRQNWRRQNVDKLVRNCFLWSF